MVAQKYFLTFKAMTIKIPKKGIPFQFLVGVFSVLSFGNLFCFR